MKRKLLDTVFYSLWLMVFLGFVREFLPLYELIWTKPVDLFIQSVSTNIWDWTPHEQPNKTPPFDTAWILGAIFCLVARVFITFGIFLLIGLLRDKYIELRNQWLKQ